MLLVDSRIGSEDLCVPLAAMGLPAELTTRDDAAILRFWSRVTITDACWLWDSPSTRGYGGYWFQNKHWLVHRLAWHLTIEPVLPGKSGGEKCICHTCDIRACVRPSHLFKASQTVNIYDMIDKGRQRGAPGIRNRHAKLAEDQIRTIRTQYGYRGRNGRKSAIALATEYGINRNMIRAIVTRKSWSHVAD